jgi:hypothetical protein
MFLLKLRLMKGEAKFMDVEENEGWKAAEHYQDKMKELKDQLAKMKVELDEAKAVAVEKTDRFDDLCKVAGDLVSAGTTFYTEWQGGGFKLPRSAEYNIFVMRKKLDEVAKYLGAG